MRIPVVSALAWILFALSTGELTCCAEEFATATYRRLCGSLGMTVGGSTPKRPLELKLIVSTTHPGMKPSDIRLTLRSADESVRLAVAEDGSVDLPVSQKWFDADAIVESNVPKGQWDIRVQGVGKVDVSELFVDIAPHLNEGHISYAALIQVARTHRQRAFNVAAEEMVGRPIKQDDIVPDRLDRKWALVLWAPKESDSAKAVLIEKDSHPGPPLVDRLKKALGGRRSKLRVVGDGMFVIFCSEALAEENPMVSLSPNPSWSCAILDVDQLINDK